MPSTTQRPVEGLVVEEAGGILRLVIDRPSRRNALTPPLCEAMAAALRAAAQREDLCAVVLTGAEDAFCAGLDLRDAAERMGRGELRGEALERAVDEGFHALIRAVVEQPHPVVARMPGSAVGFGFDLALACDLRAGVRQAKYGAIFTRLGLVPDGGGTWSLQRIAGLPRALELILTARTFDGLEAHRYGILHEVADTIDALDAIVDAWLERLRSLPAHAVRAARRLVRDAATLSLDEALRRERDQQLALLSTPQTLAALAGGLSRKER